MVRHMSTPWKRKTGDIEIYRDLYRRYMADREAKKQAASTGIDLSRFLPPRLIEECFEKHIRIKVVPSLDGDMWAQYDVESDEILLNAAAGADRQRRAEHLSEVAGIKVEPEAVFVLLLFHEIGHYHQRKKLRGVEDLKVLREILFFRKEREEEAWCEAINSFWDWKLNSSAQADYTQWKEKLRREPSEWKLTGDVAELLKA